MRVVYGALLLAMLCSSASLGQWLGGDFLNLGSTFANLHSNIQQNLGQLNHQIRSNVRNYFTEVEAFHKDLQKQLGTAIPVVVDPVKGNSVIISSNSASVGGSAGSSRTVYSGFTPEGQPYYRDSERKVVNGILHQFERAYDPASKKVKEYHYTLDLSNPQAKPIEVRNSNDEEKVEEAKKVEVTK